MPRPEPLIDHRRPRTRGHSRAIGPVGAVARVLVGLGLVALAVLGAGHPLAWWQLALGLLGLPAALTAAQLAVVRFSDRQLQGGGHIEACVNCALLVALLSASATRGATLVFLGVSMLLAAARGYGGCESLAISNWLLRRDDQVGCMVFSPLDHTEGRRRVRSASRPTMRVE